MTHAVFLACLLPAVAVAGFTVAGRVVDESGAGVTGASVSLRLADRSPVARGTTHADGQFSLSAPGNAALKLEVSHPGFSPAQVIIRDNTNNLQVRLTVQPISATVTVTAETGRVAGVDDIPQRANLISQALIDKRGRTSTVDLFREEAGVDVQRTTPAIGGVSVRGLLGKNVAVYRDGVRYTTSAQRGGVSTFWNLNEFTNLDSVEVLRGPNSAQYGSDSIGGTVHLLSKMASSGLGFHGEFAPQYFSGARSLGGNLLTSYGGTRFSWVTNMSGRRVNTLRTGGGVDTHAAVTRFLGLPSTVFGTRLPDTGLTQYGGMIHGLYLLSGRSRIAAHYERNQQDGAKRYDQLLGGDGNLIADLRNLMLDFGYLRYTRYSTGWFDQFSATASYNAQREMRVNQGGNGDPLAAITTQYERTRALGGNVHLTSRLARHEFLIGADGYHERERAPAFTVDPASGAVALTRPRIPDGARYVTYGLYLQDAFEPFRNGRLRLSGALRFGGASYRSRAENSPVVDGRPLWPDDSLAANAVTGRVGAVVRLAEPLRLHFHYSRGFRAPGMTDLGTVGIQGNGMYETSFADLAGRGALIGDRADDRGRSSGRAVAPVRPETSDNYDIAITVRRSRFRIETGAFLIHLNDTIVSQTLILPAGAAVGQALGDQVITNQLATGAVFVPAATSPVLVRGNLGRTRLYGVEHQLEADLPAGFLFAENVTWNYATDLRSGLPPDIEGGVPPLTASIRLRWAPRGTRYWVEGYSTAADRQNRLSSLALADRRAGAARSRANIARFFNNGARVRGLVSGGRLIATGESLAQVQDRVLGGTASAPMFTAIPGYAVHGVRAGMQLAEQSTVFADFSNLLDKSHRGVSWGIDGAGRSFTLRYQYRF